MSKNNQTQQTGVITLTDEQMAQYKAVVDGIESICTLSDEEKENLIRSIMEKPFLDLICDFAFKYVFQHDMESLLMLLNDILPEKIVSVSTKPNELVSPVAEDKKPVLDILAETDDGRKIIIESSSALPTSPPSIRAARRSS